MNVSFLRPSLALPSLPSCVGPLEQPEMGLQVLDAGDGVQLSDMMPTLLDASELGAIATGTSLNKLEMTARYTNNIMVHLVLSDAPAVMSMAANVGALPASLGGVLDCFNAFNTLTGVVGIAADLREMRGTFKNPNATKTDRMVDLTHLVAGDILSTAASMTPLVASLAHPAAMAFFMGGQAVGIGMDIYKTMYDIKRKGQQSACPKEPSPQQPPAG